jgi:hypothetical protein
MMTVDVDRIPALQLSLADMVWDDHPEQQRWLTVVSLALDVDHVLVTCAGDERPLRIPADAFVGVRRLVPAVPNAGDEAEVHAQISGFYPGDVALARAAAAAHADAHQPPRPSNSPTQPYPNSHYEGLYGGDLDHVVDAVGGTPDAETRDLRHAATRRHLTDPHDASSVAEPTAETDEEIDERMSGWYAGDIGFIVDNKGK